MSRAKVAPSRGLNSARARDVLATIPDRASFVQDGAGKTTHAIIPFPDYTYLVALQAAHDGEVKLDDPEHEWIDADEVFAKFAAPRIAAARKSRGLTQSQLGKLVGMPQSQIARLEKNPDASSLRLIKRIAKALKIPPGELV